MTIKEIRQIFKEENIKLIPDLIVRFQEDPRKGVQQICRQYKDKYNKYLEDIERVDYMLEFDKVFEDNGRYLLAGVDEAGRGPLAGPVVAASVVLPYNLKLDGINDSKKLSEEERNRLYDEIMDKAIAVGVGIVEPQIIDQINILQATFKAMEDAVFNMEQEIDLILVDGNQTIPLANANIKQHSIVKGDYKSISIAAASIIAKVTRDRIMIEYDSLYPNYNWKSNKGYGSFDHKTAIKEFGPTKIHRMSFLNNILHN